MTKMKRPSQTASKLRFPQINRLRLKVLPHKAVKSAGKIFFSKPDRSFCPRKFSAFSRKTSTEKFAHNFSFRRSFCLRRLSVFSRKTSVVESARKFSFHRSFRFRQSAASLCKLKSFSCKVGPVRRRSSPRSYEGEEQSVERRFETLRGLVPGSFGLDAPILLEKVADYITALKMQAEAMQTLAKLLENAGQVAASQPSQVKGSNPE